MARKSKLETRLEALDGLRSQFAVFKNIVTDAQHPDHAKVSALVDALPGYIEAALAGKDGDDG